MLISTIISHVTLYTGSSLGDDPGAKGGVGILKTRIKYVKGIRKWWIIQAICIFSVVAFGALDAPSQAPGVTDGELLALETYLALVHFLPSGGSGKVVIFRPMAVNKGPDWAPSFVYICAETSSLDFLQQMILVCSEKHQLIELKSQIWHVAI